MNLKFLQNFLEQKSINIPLFWLNNYKKLNLTIEELIFLMYLKDKGVTFLFDPKDMQNELNYSLKEIMNFISTLTDKKLLTVEARKNEKGIVEEFVNLDSFYKKYTALFTEEIAIKEEVSINSNLFERIEKEFGRTLSPSELEFIKAWLQNFNEEVIFEAVKEATLNGVSSIRYIDKILYDWDKKGIKKKEDVEHLLLKRSLKEKEKEHLEVFDYDWFDEDEEE